MTRRILVVDDDGAARALVRQRAESEGLDWAVDEATTFAEGVRLATDHSYDAILLDLRLPDMDPAETKDRFVEHVNARRVVTAVTSEMSADVVNNGGQGEIEALMAVMDQIDPTRVRSPAGGDGDGLGGDGGSGDDTQDVVRTVSGVVRAGRWLYDRRKVFAVAAAVVATPSSLMWAWALGEADEYVMGVADASLGDPALSPGECEGEGGDRRCGPQPSTNAALWKKRIDEQDSELDDHLDDAAPLLRQWPLVQADVRSVLENQGFALCREAGGAPGTVMSDEMVEGVLTRVTTRVCRFYDWQGGNPVVTEEAPLRDVERLRAKVARIAEREAKKAARRRFRRRR